MRILLISNVYFPDRGGHAVPATDLAEGLAERGHHVEVVTSYPYYPEWRNKSTANLWRITHEVINSVGVSRYGMFIPTPPPGALGRLVQEATFLVSLMRHLARRGRYDAIVAYCPMLASVVFARLRSGLFGGRTWINVQDLPAEAATETGIARAGRIWQVMGQLQRKLLLRADVVSSIAPSMVAKVEAYGFETGAVLLFPNFLKQSIGAAIAQIGDERGPLGASSRPPRLLYAGNIGRKQHLLEYCRCLAASDLSFEFRVFGDGGEADRLKEWLNVLGDHRFITGPFLGEREFIAELLQADLFVVTETAEAGASFVPSKLIPAVAALTPVLAICGHESALREEVASHGLGLVGEWESAEATTVEALDMLSDPGKWGGVRERLRKRQAAYSRESALDLALATASGRLTAASIPPSIEAGPPQVNAVCPKVSTTSCIIERLGRVRRC